MTSIFSTYSTGENRVTASVLAVLRSLSLGRIERLLAAMLEQSEFELVRFRNQPSKGGAGVPDAIIHSSFRMLLETQTGTTAFRLRNSFGRELWPGQELAVPSINGREIDLRRSIFDPATETWTFTLRHRTLERLRLFVL